MKANQALFFQRDIIMISYCSPSSSAIVRRTKEKRPLVSTPFVRMRSAAYTRLPKKILSTKTCDFKALQPAKRMLHTGTLQTTHIDGEAISKKSRPKYIAMGGNDGHPSPETKYNLPRPTILHARQSAQGKQHLNRLPIASYSPYHGTYEWQVIANASNPRHVLIFRTEGGGKSSAKQTIE